MANRSNLHWTQTAEGRAKLARAQRRSWKRRRRQAASEPTMPMSNGTLASLINHATTVQEMEDYRHVLDLRDELLARLKEVA